jgi:hypothetical protein
MLPAGGKSDQAADEVEVDPKSFKQLHSHCRSLVALPVRGGGRQSSQVLQRQLGSLHQRRPVYVSMEAAAVVSWSHRIWFKPATTSTRQYLCARVRRLRVPLEARGCCRARVYALLGNSQPSLPSEYNSLARLLRL